MKKIVALVLSLVMVLGLATTAFAAATASEKVLTGTYDFVSVDATDGEPTANMKGLSVFASDAQAAKDTDKDGKIDQNGWVKYFHTSQGYYLQVAKLADADFAAYYANTDTLLGYFVEIEAADAYYVGNAVAFTNFGDACGQLDEEPAVDTDYYFFQGVVYEESGFDNNTTCVMVGNELVPVTAYKTAADFVAHTPVYTYDKDYKVVAIECSECGAVANIVKNYMSLPEANQVPGMYFNVNGTECAYWTTAKAPAADDKVESAETFDAGIAMYVGMSVMAAAGSAVVLKKKD